MNYGDKNSARLCKNMALGPWHFEHDYIQPNYSFRASIPQNLAKITLVGRINLIQDALQAQAAHAVNLSLTARNWLVGYYIVEYEQHGEDRAKYGEKLINKLSQRIHRKGFEPRSLRLYRRLYLVYPQIGMELGPYLKKNSLHLADFGLTSIWQSATAKLQETNNQSDEIWQSAIAKLEEWATPADRLFYRLNYTCLAYLTSIEDPLKRTFYKNASS